MIKRMVVVAAALAGLFLACGWGADRLGLMQGPDVTGTVVDREGRGAKRFVTVEDQDGDRHRSRVKWWIYKACHERDQWPACKQDDETRRP